MNISILFKKTILLSIFLPIVLVGYAQPANDDFANAIDVTSFINSCSADAAYTTVNATTDLNAGSEWNNIDPVNNVWFEFVATSAQINVTVDIGGTKGTQSRTQLALWEADGTTEIQSDTYFPVFTSVDVNVQAVNLTVGNTYFISVATYSTVGEGTFTLCLEDVVDYDFYESAIDVTSLINNCSTDAQFSTDGASPDRNAGAYWNNSGPIQNRWFKFTAPLNDQLNITVDVHNTSGGGPKGDQYRTQIALWEADGTTEISSTRYDTQYDDVTLRVPGLTAGVEYYLSVDVTNEFAAGSFTLCLEAANKQGNIVINEVMYDESAGGAANNDEFIELYNAGTTAIDLNGWQLIDGNLFIIGETDSSGNITGNTSPFTFTCSGSQVCSGSTILQPGNYAVIWVGRQNASKTAPNATFQAWLDRSPKLNNTGDDVWLYDPNTTLVDYIAYGANSGINQPPLPIFWDTSVQNTLDNAGNGQSISLTSNGLDGNDSNCWEPTTSGQASGRCGTYLATIDSDSGTRIASPGSTNNGPEICGDGIDNDGDGLADCDDPECNLRGNGYDWYFGQNAGLNFEFAGGPVQVNSPLMNAEEGCSVRSDEQGNLLFYNDGITVYNKNHQVMPNGSGLLGDPSATQSGVIVQDPGNANRYYVFYINNGGTQSYYAIVDMTLNGGLGDVVAKNTLIQTVSGEKIAAWPHANGTDIWLVLVNQNNIFARLLTAGGIGAAVTSNVPSTGRRYGQMKFSPDGQQLAVTSYPQSSSIYQVQLVDFDNSTGQFSNLRQWAQDQPYGVEFSPNGDYLYVTDMGWGSAPGHIYQYTLAGNMTGAAIGASGISILSGNYLFASLQIAPDEKIYMATSLVGNNPRNGLAVINNPNTTGAAANAVADQITFTGGAMSRSGLPNIPAYQLRSTPIITVVDITQTCYNDIELQVEAFGATSYQWLLNGVPIVGETGLTIDPDAPGEYQVEVTYACDTETTDIYRLIGDNDGDCIDDVVDLDDDNDGILDVEEGCGGLNGEYYGTNSGLSNVATALAATSGTPDATFIATNIDYPQTNGSGIGNGTNLQNFLAGDAVSLSTDPGNTNRGVILINGSIYLAAGTYNMRVRSDDGYRIRIDGNTVGIYDANQGPTTRTHGNFTIATSGNYPIDFVYWDQGGLYTFTAEIRQGPQPYQVINSAFINGSCTDSDGDGIIDSFDLDSDNDGILDAVEAGHNQPHTNGEVNGTVGTDGIPDAVQAAPNNGLTNYTIVESTDDVDTIPNYLDLDSDGDGIPDNVEAQTTTGYAAPSGTVDANGVFTNYTAGLTPVNTDTADSPDYLDLDSDNEGGNDTSEAGITLANADTDNDGLDDNTDATSDYSDPGGTIDDPLTGSVILPDVDGDANSGGDVDFRDALNQADLSLTKTVNNSNPDQGDDITFTITITNNGPSPVNSIEVQDIIPTDFTYSHPNFVTSQGTVTFTAGTLEWDLGTFVLTSGSSIVLSYTLTVDICGEFKNQAEITNSSLADPDSTPGNGN